MSNPFFPLSIITRKAKATARAEKRKRGDEGAKPSKKIRPKRKRDDEGAKPSKNKKARAGAEKREGGKKSTKPSKKMENKCPLCGNSLDVDIVGMPGKDDNVLNMRVCAHMRSYRCPIWYNCLDRNVTEVTSDSYVNLVLDKVTRDHTDCRFTYQDGPKKQLSELQSKLKTKFNYAEEMLKEKSVSKHSKLFRRNGGNGCKESKVKGRPDMFVNPDLNQYYKFLEKVLKKSKALHSEIMVILEHERFLDILQNTDFKKIINSLNLAVCNIKYKDQVLTDFQMRLNSHPDLEHHASQFTYGTYNYA